MQVFRQVASIKWVYNAINKGFQEDAELLLWAALWCHATDVRGASTLPAFTGPKPRTVACDAAFTWERESVAHFHWSDGFQTLMRFLTLMLELSEVLKKVPVPRLRLSPARSACAGGPQARVFCTTQPEVHPVWEPVRQVISAWILSVRFLKGVKP